MKTKEEIGAMVLALEGELAALPAEDIEGESTAEQQEELIDIIDTVKGKGTNTEAICWLKGESSDLEVYE